MRSGTTTGPQAPVDIVEGLTEETVTKVVTALGFKAGKQESVRAAAAVRCCVHDL